ncbi:MAG TPA: methyltransferase domain-containing protein [Polyangiales bacterium]|jgi:ubiquinone/menaquinone biosynthesis C-methylase UbiE
MSEQPHRYLVPSSENEADRLRLQSKLIERPSLFVLEKVGLNAGMSALDVGCGAGNLMRLIGNIVGPAGTVTGIDLNAELGERVVVELNREAAAHYEFIAGNFLEMTAPPGAPFDLVVSRLVFSHLRDPKPAMRKLWEWTRPGGWLAIMEHDFRMIESVPETEAATMMRQLIHRVHEQAGLDPRRGSKLPSLLHEAAGGAPDGVEVTTGLLSAQDIAIYLPGSYEAYSAAAQRVGLRDMPPPGEFVASLRSALDDDLRFFLPLLVSTWKQKPATAST